VPDSNNRGGVETALFSSELYGVFYVRKPWIKSCIARQQFAFQPLAAWVEGFLDYLTGLI
jgi:hypothetical protein